jgi:hypothetical protein
MTAHTAFLDYVLPQVPGATNEMALHEIKNTIIDFCEKSLLLQIDHDPVTAINNIMDYDLEPPSGRLVTKIIRAWYKGVPLDPVGPDEINSASVYNQLSGAVIRREDPRLITQKDARSFSVYPIPNETVPNAITLRVALKPTRTSSTIDDVIFEDYAEIIGHGAISRLALSPDKPYTNPQLAVARNALYLAGVNVARDRALKGYVRVSKQVRMRRI